MNILQGKHIVIGITGSIAAYKACLLIRLLIKAGTEVQVVITPAGKEFITPVTLSALTSKPVISDFFAQRDGTWHSHVNLGLWADAMVIAPATASTIGKMANGIADNMLITTYLSMKAPVLIAPAMDLDMYKHPSTQRNLQTLRSYGNVVVEAADGELASHLTGKGRMQEPEVIVDALRHLFESQAQVGKSAKLVGKRILITAGPTYEKIDAVRFIGNYSTGKMGFALAEACASSGAEVELIAGPVSLQTKHPNIHRTDVTTAAEMYEATVSSFDDSDAAILCAAVSDFTPATTEAYKIKREGSGGLHLDLLPTRDIAQALGEKKTHQKLIGFALETNDEKAHALDKLKRKNLDFIVLNSLRNPGAGFAYDTNQISILTAQGEEFAFPLKPKTEVAEDIINKLADLF